MNSARSSASSLLVMSGAGSLMAGSMALELAFLPLRFLEGLGVVVAERSIRGVERQSRKSSKFDCWPSSSMELVVVVEY